MAPSPTLEAMRFTDRLRTSPAAKIPGTLVSSRNGSRARGQPGTRPSAARARAGAGHEEPGPVALEDRPPATPCAAAHR